MSRSPSLPVSLMATIVLSTPTMAQQRDAKLAANPLVELLKTKRILTEAEAATLSKSSSSGESDRRLAQLLLSKGLITQQEFEGAAGSASASKPFSGTAFSSDPDKARVALTAFRETVAEPAASAPVVAQQVEDPQKKSAIGGGTSLSPGFAPTDTAADARPVLVSKATLPAIAPIR